MAAVTEEPILSRLDRLDNILRQLEEIRGSGRSNSRRSPNSSCASTSPSSGGHASSLDYSPGAGSLEKHCRPINHVIMEIEQKGSLLGRLDQVEDRLLKLEVAEKKREEEESSTKYNKRERRKGIKRLVRSCVSGGI